MSTIEFIERYCQLLEERRKELSIKSACRLQRKLINPIAYYLGSDDSEVDVNSINSTPLKSSICTNLLKSPLKEFENLQLNDYEIKHEEFIEKDFCTLLNNNLQNFTPLNQNFKQNDKSSTKKKRYRPKISFYKKLGPEVVKSDDEFIYVEKPPVEKPKTENLKYSSVASISTQPLRRSTRNKEKTVLKFIPQTDIKQTTVLKPTNNSIQKTNLLKKKKNHLNIKDVNANTQKIVKPIQLPQEGLRRSARNKVKPLDPSINQRPIYEIVDGELSLTGVTDVSIKRRDRKKFAHYANFVTK